MIIDTHAHLDGPEYAADLSEAMARARAADVGLVVVVGQDETTSARAIDLAAEFAGLAPAVGVHPHQAQAAGDLSWLEALSRDPAVVAIGEIGLDYHYDFAPRAVQRDLFARQLELAARRRLPAVIHCREAEEELGEILRAHNFCRGAAVIHCFTGSYALGKAFMDEFDVYLGIGGALTFKSTLALQDAAAHLPLDRLVLETDCPYMTPAPHRGRRNEPAYVQIVCRRLAQLRGQTDDAIAAATSQNALRLFPRLADRLAAAGRENSNAQPQSVD